MPTPIWKGSIEIQLQPGFPRFRREARGATLTLQFRGPYTSLRTYGPNIGDGIVLSAFGYEPGYEVILADSVECQADGPGEDGAGTLTVTYSNLPNAGALLVAGSEMIEIDFSVLEKPLIQHPLFSTGGAWQLTDDDRKGIDTWRADQSTANYNACSTNGRRYLDKVKGGIESYVVGAPIARRTTRGASPPVVTSVGTRSPTAPVSGAPAGYEWLKTGDRAIRQAPAAGWERVEEWTGGKSVDSDLYTGII